MRARILRPEEWGQITAPGIPELVPYVEPQNLAIVVVEDEMGDVAASVCAMQVTHLEGLWIKPEYRGNAGVFRALIRQAYAVPRMRGEGWVFGGAETGDVKMDRLCTRLGGKRLPVAFYAMPVGG